MKRTIIKTLTLESLRGSDAVVAQVWRFLLENPQSTIADICEGLGLFGNSQSEKVRRLVSQGWACRSGSGTQGKPYRYTALVNENPTPRPLNERLSEIRKELTRIARKAHEARYTALAGKMGAALAEIEKEITEVRERLYVRGR